MAATPILFACAHAPTGASADAAGRADGVERLDVPAPSLAGSLLPSRPTQPAPVLLPAGYHRSRRAYPDRARARVPPCPAGEQPPAGPRRIT